MNIYDASLNTEKMQIFPLKALYVCSIIIHEASLKTENMQIFLKALCCSINIYETGLKTENMPIFPLDGFVWWFCQ